MREGGMLNGREPQWDEVPDPHDPVTPMTLYRSKVMTSW